MEDHIEDCNMKNNSKSRNFLIACTIVILLISTISIQVIGIPQDEALDEITGGWELNVEITNKEESPYEGRLRVYLIEPVSRWNDYNEDPYHFGLYDFIKNEDVTIEDTYTVHTLISMEEYPDLDLDNIMIVAALFNEESHEKYSWPPDNGPFQAHYVDAAAVAKPGMPGSNTVTETFTHTVLCEMGTRETCPYCPWMSKTLFKIYESDDYPFYFVSVIYGSNSAANKRLTNDYNLKVLPTGFFDGGYEVFAGGSLDENLYRQVIESCGERDVHDLDLSVSFEWRDDLAFPPTVTIDEPQNGLYFLNEKKRDLSFPLIIGAFNIVATAYDNESGIDHVDFYINEEKRSTDDISPYKYANWQEFRLFGKYTIKVVAVDKFGFQNSDEITVWKIF